MAEGRRLGGIDFAAIMGAALGNPLGVVSLCVMGLAVLALNFFKEASEGVRVAMFTMLFAGTIAFAVVLLREAPKVEGTTGTAPDNSLDAVTGNVTGEPTGNEQGAEPEGTTEAAPSPRPEHTVEEEQGGADTEPENRQAASEPAPQQVTTIKFAIRANENWCDQDRVCSPFQNYFQFKIFLDGEQVSDTIKVDSAPHKMRLVGEGKDGRWDVKLNGSCSFDVNATGDDTTVVLSIVISAVDKVGDLWIYRLDRCSTSA